MCSLLRWLISTCQRWPDHVTRSWEFILKSDWNTSCCSQPRAPEELLGRFWSPAAHSPWEGSWAPEAASGKSRFHAQRCRKMPKVTFCSRTLPSITSLLRLRLTLGPRSFNQAESSGDHGLGVEEARECLHMS